MNIYYELQPDYLFDSFMRHRENKTIEYCGFLASPASIPSVLEALMTATLTIRLPREQIIKTVFLKFYGTFLCVSYVLFL